MNLDLELLQNVLGGVGSFTLGGLVLAAGGAYFGWLVSLLRPETDKVEQEGGR